MNNFNIFLESNDKASMVKFNENYNMEFTIALPERFRFGDWEVCLKSLILLFLLMCGNLSCGKLF